MYSNGVRFIHKMGYLWATKTILIKKLENASNIILNDKTEKYFILFQLYKIYTEIQGYNWNIIRDFFCWWDIENVYIYIYRCIIFYIFQHKFI